VAFGNPIIWIAAARDHVGLEYQAAARDHVGLEYQAAGASLSKRAQEFIFAQRARLQNQAFSLTFLYALDEIDYSIHISLWGSKAKLQTNPKPDG
jgi:hypothetical protein